MMNYRSIVQVEMELFRRYKVMFWESEKNMTMLDLQGFVKQLNNENEREEKQMSSGNGSNWIKSLFAIGDIINFMRYKDTRPR